MRRRLGSVLVGAALVLGAVLVPSSAPAATSLAIASPGAGTWEIGQMWHGGALGGGIVPAGTSIDLSPVDGSPLDVYSVGAGRIVKTCVADRQSTVFVDTAGIGVIGYSHLATGSIPLSGTVVAGQRLGTLATTYVKSACATSWTGPHLHLSLPARYDVLRIAGQVASRYAVLALGQPRPVTAFRGRASSSLKVTRRAARVVVCADNLPGNVVHVRLSRPAAGKRPAKVWRASKVATSRCVTFANLVTGRTVARKFYGARSALNQLPLPAWTAKGCYAQSRAQGLCNRDRRR